MADRGYLNLLTHLTRSSTTLPLPTLQASLAHYLANTQPSPTPLAASVASSPLFRHPTSSQLEALQTAFRHALHFRAALLQKEEEGVGGVFRRGVRARTGEWVRAVLKGLEGGNGALRLACSSGLLLGLGDRERDESRVRRKVEEEVILALAEVMDLHSNASSGWEREFKTDAQDTLSAALLVVSRSSSLLAPHRLTVLPLSSLTRLLLSTIDSAFESGTFLSSLHNSLQHDTEGKLTLQPNSPFADKVRMLNASPTLSSMASLSAMYVQVLSALADSRPPDAWAVMAETMQRLERLTGTIESDWLRSALSAVSDEEAIQEPSREIITTMWTILKTLLFTTIRLVQSALSVVAFVPGPQPPLLSSASPAPTSSPASSSSPPVPSPFALALAALHIFSHLSFVLPQFGGVASTGEDSFPELKRVFYTALDVLSADAGESARFVRELRTSFLPDDGATRTSTWPARFFAAKKAYALACVEQLVPVLDDYSIRNDVYPLCAPHLDDTSHRETFESAHSVILAVLAAHAVKAEHREHDGDGDGRSRPPFAEEFVPAYTECLITNAADGGLNGGQLCLAYRALVRSAGTFGSSGASGAASESDGGLSAGDAFAWYCVEALLRAIHSLPSPSPTTTTPPSSTTHTEHQQRLHRALVASVSAVSRALLPRLLEAVRDVVEAEDDMNMGQRRALVEALFEEIATRVGDEEKEFAVRWWYENRVRLLGRELADVAVEAADEGEGKGKGKARELTARL